MADEKEYFKRLRHKATGTEAFLVGTDANMCHVEIWGDIIEVHRGKLRDEFYEVVDD